MTTTPTTPAAFPRALFASTASRTRRRRSCRRATTTPSVTGSNGPISTARNERITSSEGVTARIPAAASLGARARTARRRRNNTTKRPAMAARPPRRPRSAPATASPCPRHAPSARVAPGSATSRTAARDGFRPRPPSRTPETDHLARTTHRASRVAPNGLSVRLRPPGINAVPTIPHSFNYPRHEFPHRSRSDLGSADYV
mmetsp:Transcript_220/g.860  ORF Transcript_220/g.860 Transcript_220/m.860 type:complete len:201 (+) Transcript_220:1022-1624(+)